MSLLDLIPGVSQVKLLAYGFAAMAIFSAATYGVHLYNQSVRKPLQDKITLMQGTITGYQTRVSELTTINKNLAGSVEHQNSAIDSLQANAEKKIKDSEQAVAEAKKLTTQSNQRVKEIIASAPLSKDLCESARLRMVPQ